MQSYSQVRALRSQFVHDTVIEAMRELRAAALQAWIRHRQRSDAQAMREALAQLDDRTLKDLGFDRSEIGSVASEATLQAQATRLRVL